MDGVPIDDTEVDPDGCAAPVNIAAILQAVFADSDDRGLSAMGFGPAHETARVYYQKDGSLRSGVTHASMGYTPHAVAFVARNKVEAVMAGIATIESGGGRVGNIDYGAKGPPTSHGTRAIGGWQVMSENICPWAAEAGLQCISVEQFKNSPEIQHAVVYHQIEKLLGKGYSERDVASIWFTGHRERPGDTNSDGYTTASTYVDKFANAYAQVKVDPSAATVEANTASANHGQTVGSSGGLMERAVSYAGRVGDILGLKNMASLPETKEPTEPLKSQAKNDNNSKLSVA